MKLSKEDRKRIARFFKDEGYTNLFVELYNFQEQQLKKESDLGYIIQGNKISVCLKNEEFFYVTEESNGFFIQINSLRYRKNIFTNHSKTDYEKEIKKATELLLKVGNSIDKKEDLPIKEENQDIEESPNNFSGEKSENTPVKITIIEKKIAKKEIGFDASFVRKDTQGMRETKEFISGNFTKKTEIEKSIEKETEHINFLNEENKKNKIENNLISLTASLQDPFIEECIEEENINAKTLYANLKEEIEKLEEEIPNPEVERYDNNDVVDYPDREYIIKKREENEDQYKKIDAVRAYYDLPALYIGHMKEGSLDFYFYESPENKKMPNKRWGNVALINVEDKLYQSRLNSWKYPQKENEKLLFSRQITMEGKTVCDLEVTFDRRKETYESVSDSYLRKALIKNKERDGIHGIIKTIQEKQNKIRELDVNTPFIVQGCAGSGKTMVLLHRLKYLLFNEDVKPNEFALLIPGEDFKSFTKDITKDFGISSEDVFTYSEYYQQMILGKRERIEEYDEQEDFPLEYLQSVYSSQFILDCVKDSLDHIETVANKLIDRADL